MQGLGLCPSMFKVGDLTIFHDTVFNEIWLGRVTRKAPYGEGFRYGVKHFLPEPSSGVFLEGDDELHLYTPEKLESLAPGKAQDLIRAFEEAEK